MGTTADKLAYLENTKSAIREALARYGRGPDEAAPFRAYAGLIDGMGRSLEDSEVNFFDYDGSLIAAYTLEELAALEALPEAPVHEGLVFQGWSLSLEELKAGGRPAEVGAVYTTEDGVTRLYLNAGNGTPAELHLRFIQSAADGLSVDWGDGSAPETYPMNGGVDLAHTYAAPGDYVISLSPAPDCEVILGDGEEFNVLNGSESCCAPSCGLYRVNMGAGIKIGKSAFAGCSFLQSISMPLGLAEVGELAFVNCFGLRCAVMPPGLTSIGFYAFGQCFSLRRVSIPNCSIDDYAFTTCYTLDPIYLPEGLTRISNQCFVYCCCLTRLSLPESLTEIGTSAFGGCGVLRELRLPDSVRLVDYGAFSYCSSLSQLELGSGLLQLGEEAFCNCPSLYELYIPASVESIGAYAFAATGSGLRRVFCLSETPPVLGDYSVFDDSSFDLEIFVPAASLEAYKSAEFWSSMAHKIKAL